jgi:drug/metabolite transporter (DMT)-like permease
MKRATNHMQPLAIAAGISAAAMVLLLPGALWTLPQANFTPTAMVALLIMGVFTSGLAYWLTCASSATCRRWRPPARRS